MFTIKKKYFLIIESIKDIDLKNIKKRGKFFIIYRYKNKPENLTELKKFKKKCSIKSIKFYIANNIRLCVLLNSDGIYLSSYNKSFKALCLKKKNFDILGSAHNQHEIALKLQQGCNSILFSKLFRVDYNKRSSFLGICKFNKLLTNYPKQLIPLGGIKLDKLNCVNNINCLGIAIFSEVKKKPAIISRLF